jgi:uncharacterized low-complexity protein
MKKQNLVSLAVGSAFAAIALSPAAHAADNPFGATKLQAGYQLAQADTKMKDGSCGGDKKMDAKCGADKKADAKCGADKKKDASCGAAKKSGEAKCGADKKKDASCGAKK